MAEFDITYKIIILDILWYANGTPLTNAQVSGFFLENALTDYFTVQDAIGALIETGNIDVIPSANQVFYKLNAKGSETLSLFPDRITKETRNLILLYLRGNEIAIREENSLVGDYFKSSSGYVCHLKKTDGNVSLIDLSIHIPDRTQAEAICANWKVKANDVYDALMDILV